MTTGFAGSARQSGRPPSRHMAPSSGEQRWSISTIRYSRECRSVSVRTIATFRTVIKAYRAAAINQCLRPCSRRRPVSMCCWASVSTRGSDVRGLEWCSPAATRSTEFRQLTGQHARRTTVGWEYPFDATAADVPMYPVPSRESAALFARYARAARSAPDVHFCGRLGTYSYLNMDAAVARALALADELA